MSLRAGVTGAANHKRKLDCFTSFAMTLENACY